MEPNYIKLFLKFIFLLIINIRYFHFFTNRQDSLLLERKSKESFNNVILNNNNTNFEYFFCFCGIGKKENLYSRQLISYYLNLGVEKFVFGDNNEPNTEKLSDVLQDYISNGTVDIIDIIGSSIDQSKFYGILYEKYKKRCEWLSFFDFDEYLVIRFEEGNNLALKEFLPNKIFDKCEAIVFNWLVYNDNDLVYYDNRTILERFTTPSFEDTHNSFVKSIVRGNLDRKPFIDKKTNHRPVPEIKVCNSTGNLLSTYSEGYPPNYKNGYLIHFALKTAEEYIAKMLKGACGGHKFNINHLEQKVNFFFLHNKFTKEKLKVFETYFNRTFDFYYDY